jgi:hypothetical protein
LQRQRRKIGLSLRPQRPLILAMLSLSARVDGFDGSRTGNW